ncbi:MAG TPA: hypothetical protein VGP53_09300 [Acidimicrobiales bacterium]|nr:hypothetical protein [Acidimicrobiales bacterium]
MLSAVAKAYLVLALVVGAFTAFYLDPLSLSSSGGGDHFGVTLLVTIVVGALAFAYVTSTRPITDNELEPLAADDAPPPTLQPVATPGPTAGASAFPLLAAVGLLATAVASAIGGPAFYLGLALLLVAAGGWLGQAFAEHPLATPRLGDRLSRRTTSPFTYPVLGVLLGAVIALSVSRLYLTITEEAAIVVSGLVATVLFLGCLALASDRNTGRRLTGGLAGLALVSVIGAGAASAARGERVIEHHGESEVTEQEIEAEGIQYSKDELTLTEGKVRFTFDNDDPKGTYHNVGVYSEKEGGKPFVAILAIDGGQKASTLIDTEVVGLTPGSSYFFRCDFHPAMVGTLEVVEAPEAEHSSEGSSKKKVEKH